MKAKTNPVPVPEDAPDCPTCEGPADASRGGLLQCVNGHWFTNEAIPADPPEPELSPETAAPEEDADG